MHYIYSEVQMDQAGTTDALELKSQAVSEPVRFPITVLGTELGSSARTNVLKVQDISQALGCILLNGGFYKGKIQGEERKKPESLMAPINVDEEDNLG